MSTAAVILAAGASTRFGAGHKLLADFRGRPLVSWAVEHACAAELDETLVVTGAADVEVPAGVRLVRNEEWSGGLATSLRAGIAAAGSAGHDAVVVGLGDQPLIEPAAWRAVADSPAPIAVAVYGERQGHPVRLAREVWPLLPAVGERGAATVMRDRPDLVAGVPCPGDPADIDTEEDLETWS